MHTPKKANAASQQARVDEETRRASETVRRRRAKICESAETMSLANDFRLLARRRRRLLLPHFWPLESSAPTLSRLPASFLAKFYLNAEFYSR